MLAGAAAGITEHTAMYPVDTIKTRMQALSHPGQRLHGSVVRALRAVVRREGVAGLYRGVGAVAWGAGPAHAMYFATYEQAKQLLGGNRQGYQWLPTATAGAIATIVNDGFMTPVDVVKQRLQVAHSPYTGLADCTRQILRHEGVGALYKSYRTTVLMNVPFTAMHFSVYEAAKKWLLHVEDGDDAAEDRLSVQLVAGGLAGGAAAAVTTPLDVVKTRLQTEGVHSSKRYGTTAVLPVLRRIIQEEGMATIWRGMKPRVLFNAPAAAVSEREWACVRQLSWSQEATTPTSGVNAGSNSGGVNAGSNSGGVNAGSNSGGVNAGSNSGGVNAESNSGGVNAASNSGGVDAGSNSGGVDAGSNSGGVDAGSNSGGVNAGSNSGGVNAGSNSGGGGSML
ncbi:mitochondrial carrier domain-containing protein [Scenedesmus sp. NREL 46B-D3]|nr:mitochondrial carrier domain-containing protein [Scenedesmus sp. NREL 46B-D3]